MINYIPPKYRGYVQNRLSPVRSLPDIDFVCPVNNYVHILEIWWITSMKSLISQGFRHFVHGFELITNINSYFQVTDFDKPEEHFSIKNQNDTKSTKRERVVQVFRPSFIASSGSSGLLFCRAFRFYMLLEVVIIVCVLFLKCCFYHVSSEQVWSWKSLLPDDHVHIPYLLIGTIGQ